MAASFDRDQAALIRVQQEAGLDFFSDGLLRWEDIFRPLAACVKGMDAHTLIRWFDNNSFFRAPELTSPVILERDLPRVYEHGDGLPHPRVATLPSPYTFSRAVHGPEDRNGAMVELARELLRPVAGNIASRGYRLIHLEEPWIAYQGIEPGDWDYLESALVEIREGLPAEATVVLHTYFGDAAPLVERLRRLPVDAVGIDFMETDVDALGSGWEVGVLAGCLDGRSSLVEDAVDIVAFAERVAEHLQPPALYLSSSSELEFLPWDVAAAKVRRLGDVAAPVKERLS